MITDRFEAASKTLVIKIKGDVLSTRADGLTTGFEDVLKRHQSSNWEKVKLDLNSTKMVDSTGLNILLGLVRNVKESGKDMVIHIAAPSVKRVLEFSHFYKMVEVVYKEKKKKVAAK